MLEWSNLIFLKPITYLCKLIFYSDLPYVWGIISTPSYIHGKVTSTIKITLSSTQLKARIDSFETEHKSFSVSFFPVMCFGLKWYQDDDKTYTGGIRFVNGRPDQ